MRDSASNDRELIDMATAIDMLQTSRPTFYRWLRAGKVKGHKVGRQWRFYRDDIERFLKGEAPRIELPVSPAPLLEELAAKLQEAGDELGVHDPEDRPVDELVNRMIRLGWILHASDIHVGPLTTGSDNAVCGMLRYRIDGVMQHPIPFVDRRLLPAVVERWKAMACVDLNETKLPQEGRILLALKQVHEKPVRLDIRVCFVPAAQGESLTARLLNREAASLSLDLIPYADADRRLLQDALQQPTGMVVVTGPTGSGKTTTVYACLNELTRPEVKVMTIEDPVEYILPWVTQIPVNMGKGLTFAAALRSILRSDPDVIMVGEIRDFATMSVSFQAALTGNLVLTQLHAGSAAGALVRMMDMGSDPFLIAESVKLATAQRLVRLLCPDCKKPVKHTPEQFEKARELALSGGLDDMVMEGQFYGPGGCQSCGQTGYRGRTVMAEMLPVTPAIGRALRDRCGVDDIERVAVAEGMTTFKADGIRRAAHGQTSLSEVFRVLAGT